MSKEYFNYKDRIILEQYGRWYSLYVEGSLVHANMNKEEAIKVYFSYVKALKESKEDHKQGGILYEESHRKAHS